MKNLLKTGLSSNQLKILAVIFMTIDHVGLYFFPGMRIFRIIGRLAFPIFAYTIAEGSKYSRNPRRRLILLGITAILCQLFYTLFTASLYMNIFATFFMSALIILCLDYSKEKNTPMGYLLLALCIASVFAVCYLFPLILKNTGFAIDYGFLGTMLPPLIYIGRTKKEKLCFLFFGLIFVALPIGTIQLFSLLAVPVVALYNGTRGKFRMKYFFYIYYPLHLAIIFMISIFIACSKYHV